MNWSARYLGIPWSKDDLGMKGTHCYGLCRLVYREELGIGLEDFGASLDGATNAVVIGEQRLQWPWRAVSQPRPFDLVVFRLGAVDDHIGIVVDRSLMLHVRMGSEAKVEPFHGPAWTRRLVGFHRHIERGGEANG